MAVIVVVFAVLVGRTRYFAQYYYIGGNARAARRFGVNVDRTMFFGFVIMGLLAGLAGALLASRLNTAVVLAGNGVELKVITAVVLGGASLSGGVGRISGAFLGVLFMALTAERDDHRRHQPLLAADRHRHRAARLRRPRPVRAGADAQLSASGTAYSGVPGHGGAPDGFASRNAIAEDSDAGLAPLGRREEQPGGQDGGVMRSDKFLAVLLAALFVAAACGNQRPDHGAEAVARHPAPTGPERCRPAG